MGRRYHVVVAHTIAGWLVQTRYTNQTENNQSCIPGIGDYVVLLHIIVRPHDNDDDTMQAQQYN